MVATAGSTGVECAGAGAGRSELARGSDSQLLSAREKERVGRCCKRLIDMGRVWYLRTVLGLTARLVCYAPESMTPENVLLLADQEQR